MPKWQLTLNNPALSAQIKQYQQFEQPFGFTKDITVSHVQLPRKKQMIEKKIMQVATSGKMQIFITLFMFWMIGNGVSIFTIFFIFQSLFSSITAILKANKIFQPYEGQVSSLFKYKLMYMGINVIQLAIVAYKLSAMGLLPVSASDYIDLVPMYQPIDVISLAK